MPRGSESQSKCVVNGAEEIKVRGHSQSPGRYQEWFVQEESAHSEQPVSQEWLPKDKAEKKGSPYFHSFIHHQLFEDQV